MFLIKVYGANHYNIQACFLLPNSSQSWEVPLVGAFIKGRGGAWLQNIGFLLFGLSFKHVGWNAKVHFKVSNSIVNCVIFVTI